MATPWLLLGLPGGSWGASLASLGLPGGCLFGHLASKGPLGSILWFSGALGGRVPWLAGPNLGFLGLSGGSWGASLASLGLPGGCLFGPLASFGVFLGLPWAASFGIILRLGLDPFFE